MRAKSLSNPSPNASGKSSPCPSYSGKVSPNPQMDDGKLMNSPRKKFIDMKNNIALTSKPMITDRCPKSPRINLSIKSIISESETNGTLYPAENGAMNHDPELSKIPEETQQMSWSDMVEQEESQSTMEQTPAAEQIQEQPNLEAVLCFDQYCQTSGFIDEYLTLQQYRDKYEKYNTNTGSNGSTNENSNENLKNEMQNANPEGIQTAIVTSVSHTINKLDEMENKFLEKNVNQPSNLIQTTVVLSKENEMNSKKTNEAEKKATPSMQPEEKKVQTANPIRYSNVVTRPVINTKPNNLQKMPINRLNVTKPTGNVIGRLAVPNANLMRKQPLKSNSTTTIHKPKIFPTTQKDVTVNSDRRTARAAVVRTNGIPSNTASRLAARSKTMIELDKKPSIIPSIKKSSSRDSMGSSTSTLRASNEQISGSQNKLNMRKSEPRTMPPRFEDDDGWLTVKARRRSSLHWANRFNQPSGYTSLPTLALLNEKESPKPNNNKKENKKTPKPASGRSTESEVAKPKAVSVSTSNGSKDVPSGPAKTTNGESKAKPKNTEQPPKSKETEKQSAVVSRATILQRQRSDVTGLKLNNLRKEYFRIEKTKKLKDLKKASVKDQPNNDKNGIHMKVQTINKAGLSSVMCELYTSCLASEASNSEMNKRDIESDDTETEHDEDQKKLIEEQWCLERQILELQNTDIDLDPEMDDTDTILGFGDGDSNNELAQCDADDNVNLEAKYQHLLSDMSTGERIQTLATLQAFVSRHPGRAQELHQKLSSPSHRSLTEILEKYQEKQDRARGMRETLNKEKTLKLQALLARVEDVKIAKHKLIEERRNKMEEKLQRYAENRNQYIKHKIRKAHDEEEKLKEIAFIKSLEAQNKRLDLMELRKEQEGRLQDLEAERQKRVEEKAAKEAAVERRRLELALERQKRLERIDETRREREQRVVSMQEEREKMRQQIAREKVI